MAMVRHAQAVQDIFLAHYRKAIVRSTSTRLKYPTDDDESESGSFEYPFEYGV